MGLELSYSRRPSGDWKMASPKREYTYQCGLCHFIHNEWSGVSRRFHGMTRMKLLPHKPGIRPGKRFTFNCSDATACRRRRRRQPQDTK